MVVQYCEVKDRIVVEKTGRSSNQKGRRVDERSCEFPEGRGAFDTRVVLGGAGTPDILQTYFAIWTHTKLIEIQARYETSVFGVTIGRDVHASTIRVPLAFNV